MDTDEVLLALDPGGQTGDRQRGGVRPQHRVGLDDVLDLLEHLVLEFLVFEHGLDDEVHALEVGRVGGRGDASQQRVALLLSGATALECLGHQLLGVALALGGGLRADVLEHHVVAGLGRDVGDARAHHAGTEHTDLGDRGLADAVRPRLAGVDGLQVEEERLNHVLGDLAGDQRGEVAALDAAGGVEIDLRTFDRGGQNGLRGRHRSALELLAQQGRERRQDGSQPRRRRSAARDLVTLLVPGLFVGIRVGLDPRLGGGHQLLDRRQHLVDQPDLLGLGRLEPGALGQDAHEGVLDTEHAHGAGHPAATGQQAQGHLGQTQLAALGVGRDAVMAGQRNLEATAECRAVDRGDDGLAQRLQGSQLPLDRLDRVEGLPGVFRTGLDHGREVTTGEEGLLGAGDHHSGNRILFGDKAIHRLAHRLDVGLVHDVGRPRRVVHGQRDDAVGILVPLNCVVGHLLKPSR